MGMKNKESRRKRWQTRVTVEMWYNRNSGNGEIRSQRGVIDRGRMGV